MLAVVFLYVFGWVLAVIGFGMFLLWVIGNILRFKDQDTHLVSSPTTAALLAGGQDVYEKNSRLPLPQLDWSHAGLKDSNLFCYGCAHSASSAPPPGYPSGERPCGFCVRHPMIRSLRKVPPGDHIEGFEPRWYDGTPPVKLPMDCYQTVDMIYQQHMQDGGSKDDVLYG